MKYIIAALFGIVNFGIVAYTASREDIRGDIIRLAIGDRPVIANVTVRGGELGYGFSAQHIKGLIGYNIRSIGALEIMGNDYAESTNSYVLKFDEYWSRPEDRTFISDYAALCPNKPKQDRKYCRDIFFGVKKILPAPMPLPSSEYSYEASDTSVAFDLLNDPKKADNAP